MKTAAMIFAAGLGTRLYPLTADRPKALVEINGVSLLETAIRKLIRSGFRNIVVNVHHFSDQVIDFIAGKNFDAEIHISDETGNLFDTAGGLKFAAPFFTGYDHILLHNVDIISSIDLRLLVEDHVKSKALATLAVKWRETFRYFVFDECSMRLCGWKNHKTGEEIEVREARKPVELAFSGIHVVKREIIDMIPVAQKLSFTPLYLDLSKEYEIRGYPHQPDSWMDIGKYEDYVKISRET